MSARIAITRRALAASAVVLAVAAAAVGAPTAPPRAASAALGDGERPDTYVTRTVNALQLAAWIREGARDLRVLDLRPRSAYEQSHIPSAEGADFARLDTLARVDAPVVVYSNDDVRDAQAWASLAARGHRRAYVLDGGMDAWTEEVMDPVLHGDSADYVAALSRYFGGVPRVREDDGPRAPLPRAASVRTRTPQDGDAGGAPTGEFGETQRRGC